MKPDMEQGLEKILERIRSESEGEISRILKEAEQEARKIISRAEEEAERLRQKAREEISSQGLKDAQKVLANARIQERRSQAEAREEGLRQAFSLADELLKKLVRDGEVDGISYFQVLLDYSLSAAEQLGSDFEIRLSAGERQQFGKELLSSLSKAAKQKGKASNAYLGEETLSVSGGALFLAEGGKVMIDQTFPARTKNRRSDLRSRAARILFE